jgi:hypothetical protein
MTAYEKLLAACEDIAAELIDRYDGAPDSGSRWMGCYIEQLEAAIAAVKAAAAGGKGGAQ